MFEETSDLLRPAPRTVGFKTRTPNRPIATGFDAVTATGGENAARILRDPRYRHFARIPGRIVRCLDYFGVGCDRFAAARILAAYYLFIAVVDDAIDSGETQVGAMVLQHLSTRSAASEPLPTDVAVITENLKRELDYQIDSCLRDQFWLLYETVSHEKAAKSIDAYTEVRKAVGQLTADLSYRLISPLLERDSVRLRAFMRKVGAVGCLVDSVIDLDADKRRGLLSFQPTMRDWLKLALITCGEGLSIALRHPRLAGLFLMSILDTIHDRFPLSRPARTARMRNILVPQDEH